MTSTEHPWKHMLARFRKLLAVRLEQGESATLFRSRLPLAPAFPSGAPEKPMAAARPAARIPARVVLAANAHPAWKELAEAVRLCEACGLAPSRQHAVLGEGDSRAALVFVGEAPGEEEDRTGRPFAGEAGKLLTKIIASLNLTREEVYLCNILKCRPPGNRNPEPGEIAACRPHLERQLELLQPKLIVALGAFAAQTLLGSQEPIAALRGKPHAYHGIPVIATFHPAALLYHPQNKKLVWQDMLMAARHLGLKPVTAKRQA